MKIDIKGRLWFSLSNKEVYFLQDNIATKVYEGADGKKKSTFPQNLNFLIFERILWKDPILH